MLCVVKIWRCFTIAYFLDCCWASRCRATRAFTCTFLQQTLSSQRPVLATPTQRPAPSQTLTQFLTMTSEASHSLQVNQPAAQRYVCVISNFKLFSCFVQVFRVIIVSSWGKQCSYLLFSATSILPQNQKFIYPEWLYVVIFCKHSRKNVTCAVLLSRGVACKQCERRCTWTSMWIESGVALRRSYTALCNDCELSRGLLSGPHSLLK